MHDVENYTLGKGVLYFNYYKDGVYQGFRDLGNAPEFNVSMELDVLDHFSSRAGMKAKDKKVTQMITPKVAFTLDELTPENLSFVFMGAAETVSQAQSYGSAHLIPVVELDRYYIDSAAGKRKVLAPIYLKYNTGTGLFVAGEVVTGAGGAAAVVQAVIGTAITGILVLGPVSNGPFVNSEAITGSLLGAAVADGAEVTMTGSNFLVCNSTGTTVYTLTTDYTVDMNGGRVYVNSTGAITANSSIYIAYACEKATYKQISLAEDSELEGQLHFVSDNPVGNNYELLLWRVSLTPNGDTAFIGDGWSSMAFNGEILKDETGHPLQPFGLVIEEPTVVATTTT